MSRVTLGHMWHKTYESQRFGTRVFHMCPKECCAKWEIGELEQLVVAAV